MAMHWQEDSGDSWQVRTDRYGLTPAVRGLMLATVIAFLVQAPLDALTQNGATKLFGLSIPGLQHWRIWQLVTYLFIHGGLMHIVLNMLGLYFMGPETERAIGTRHFLGLYFVSGILGGVGWLIISDEPWATCIGASGSLFGVMGAFAALFPQRQITLLVFFILPVTMKAWVMALSLAAVELSFLLTSAGGIAYAAHLAGGVAGYVYALVLFRRPSASIIEFPSRPEVSEADDIDRILDKIARQGMGSLSRQERERLEKASRGRTA